MNKDFNDYLMEDFLADEYFIRWVKFPDAATDKFWRQLAVTMPAKAQLMQEAREIIYALALPVINNNEPGKEKVWQSVLTGIEQMPVRRMPRYRRFWLAAASILLLLSLGATWYFSSTVTMRTGYGQIRRIELPDHSILILNAHSSVSYARSWPLTGKREVCVEGEAFFDVRHLGDTFRVWAADVSVTVLGTAFNVRHRHQHTAVVLQRGRVRIDVGGRQGLSTYLQPGEEWSFESGSHSGIRRTADTAAAMAWTRHELLLNATRVKEIIRILEENYGYTVVLEDSTIAEREIKGRIPMQQDRDLLFVLSRVLDIDIKQNRDTLFFTAR
nr:FecR domain-containing protein [Chitinophaga sp. HK235]